ncbi:uncharacterized protein [Trachinotus anak]
MRIKRDQRSRFKRASHVIAKQKPANTALQQRRLACSSDSVTDQKAPYYRWHVHFEKRQRRLHSHWPTGETILTAKKWMLWIEGSVVIPPAAHLVDFTTALATLFACYYVFNLEYQVEASATLEFVQR